jgi:glyoxylase I family protein
MSAPSLLTSHHLAILVPALDAAEAFYSGVLGLPVIRRQAHAVWCDAGGCILMLELPRTASMIPEPSQGNGRMLLWAMRVPASLRETWRVHLQRHDVKVEGETAYSLYFRDPFGARLALSHYPDEAT